MKMGRTMGVVATGGVLFGLWISGWLKGFGLGGGQMTGVELSTQKQSVTSEEIDQTLNGQNPEATKNQTPGNEKPAVVVPQIELVIDDTHYFLRDPHTHEFSTTPVSITEIVQRAQETSSGDDGPRIKIYRRSSSRTSAEAQLADALAHAGFKPVDIYWHPAVTE